MERVLGLCVAMESKGCNKSLLERGPVVKATQAFDRGRRDYILLGGDRQVITRSETVCQSGDLVITVVSSEYFGTACLAIGDIKPAGF